MNTTPCAVEPGLRRFAIHDVPGMAAALESEGCALAESSLSPRLVEEARAMSDALRPLHWDEVHDEHGGRRMDRYLCVFNRDPFWLEFLDRPGIIDVAEATLGRDCHVIGETAWRCLPGFSGDALHVDYLPVTWTPRSEERDPCMPIFILTAHFYLCDVTSDLAPTRVVPGSHRAGRAPLVNESEWKGHAPIAVLARAGDCLLFRSDVWHSGSANRHPSAIRYLLQVHYGRREMAQHFSPFLDWRFNPDVIAAATKRQKRLLGDHEPGAYD
jgi:Phytanoyl-CoA dioxygenase (PhyH)